MATINLFVEQVQIEQVFKKSSLSTARGRYRAIFNTQMRDL